MSWPTWFFRQTDDTLTGLVLIAVASILVIWGVSLLWSAFRDRVGRLPGGFEFWLGAFMLADSTLYLLLAVNVLQSPEGIDLWVVGYFTAVAIPALVAFWRWARDRLPERRS